MSRPFLESVASRPLLVSLQSEMFFQGAINHITQHEHSSELLDSQGAFMANEDDDFWDEGNFAVRYGLRPYFVSDGILQIPVLGALLSRFPYQLGRWATGYTYIERAMQRGVEDEEVRGIALVMDTPGGEAAGCFELADDIFEMRGQKPIKAFSANAAYSAGYALASSADEVIVARSGGTGSVGVVTAHVDLSKAMDQMGVAITFVHAGKHKVDGNPYESLPDDVKSRMQKRIDKVYGVFTSTVARNRSMDEDAVRETEALTYDSEDSVEIGFADRIGELDDEMVIFSEEVAEIGDQQMTTKSNTNKNGIQGNGQGNDQTNTADVDQARNEGYADGEKAGRVAERERMTAILGSDEAKSRPKAAMSMAMRSKDSAEDVISMLADLPEERASDSQGNGQGNGQGNAQSNGNAQSPFDSAMSNSNNPDVGAEGDGNGSGSQDEDHATSILADFAAYTGAKKKA